MITFFGTLIRTFFHAFRSKRIILSENALLKKENDILLRRVGKKRVHFNIYDKQIQFIYAMDFFTVDSVLVKRCYVFAIISHKTREIMRFAITENPTREFVRQQLMLFTESIATRAYLIHDNALMFNIEYLAYHLVSVRTGVEAPNMNSIMERFFEDNEKRGAGQLSVNWQESGSEDSGGICWFL